jgi:mono/diheme cytochrome c family protein
VIPELISLKLIKYKIKIMSTLFNGQKDNRMSSMMRFLFSALLVVSLVLFIGSFNHQNTVVKAQVEASFAPDMGMMPLGGDVDAGKALFQAKACFACHGMNGEGNAIGPNLTDKFSKHGCSVDEIAKVITDGVAGTTMVAYKAQLKPEEIKQLAAFIKSLQGTTPANAKAAEGAACK